MRNVPLILVLAERCITLPLFIIFLSQCCSLETLTEVKTNIHIELRVPKQGAEKASKFCQGGLILLWKEPWTYSQEDPDSVSHSHAPDRGRDFGKSHVLLESQSTPLKRALPPRVAMGIECDEV